MKPRQMMKILKYIAPYWFRGIIVCIISFAIRLELGHCITFLVAGISFLFGIIEGRDENRP